MTFISDNQLAKVKLQLNALLEITQAINNNLPEENLYKLYNFTLRSQTTIAKHLLLINSDTGFELKSSFGIKAELKTLSSDEEVIEFAEQVVAAVYPIKHKEKLLAYLGITLQDGGDEEIISYIKTLSNIVLVAIENKRLARKQLAQEAIENELKIAHKVQQMLVPKTLPKTKELEMYASYIPHKSVSGDYYDYIQRSENEFIICVADVSGKGIPAAILMSNFQATLRLLVRQNLPLKKIIEELNYSIFRNSNGDRFITAFIAEYNIKDKRLCYVNAGHNPCYYLDRNHNIEELSSGTTLLGVLEELPKLEIGHLEIKNYSLLFCYTDGLVEVFDEDENLFDENKLIDFLKEEKTTSLEEMHKQLLTLISNFSGDNGYSDDITVLSCKFQH